MTRSAWSNLFQASTKSKYNNNIIPNINKSYKKFTSLYTLKKNGNFKMFNIVRFPILEFLRKSEITLGKEIYVVMPVVKFFSLI